MSTPSSPDRESRSRLKTWALNLLLVCLSLALALAIMEGVLRLYNPMGFRLKGNKVVLPVNTTEIRKNSGKGKRDETVVIHRNSLGFRGEEPPADFSRWLTVITVGGSTTECLELTDAKTWPQVLGRKLKTDFPRLWLNNAGLQGHSTQGHAVLLEGYLGKLKPKVVIFLIGVNDLGLQDLRSEDRNIRQRTGLQSFRSLEKFLETAAEHSEVAALLLNLKRYFFPKIVMMVTNQEKDLAALPTLTMSEAARTAALKPYRDNYLKLYEERLRTLARLCREHGIIPVFMTQPAVYGYGKDELTGADLARMQATSTMNGEVAWKVLELYNDVTRRVGRDEGLLVIDLARELPKDSRYFLDLTHYSNAGAEQVAEIAARHLDPFLAARFPQYRGAANPSPSPQ